MPLGRRARGWGVGRRVLLQLCDSLLVQSGDVVQRLLRHSMYVLIVLPLLVRRRGLPFVFMHNDHNLATRVRQRVGSQRNRSRAPGVAGVCGPCARARDAGAAARAWHNTAVASRSDTDASRCRTSLALVIGVRTRK